MGAAGVRRTRVAGSGIILMAARLMDDNADTACFAPDAQQLVDQQILMPYSNADSP